MSLNLHEKAEEAYNKKAFELVSIVEKIVSEKSSPQKLTGSISHVPVVDWSGKMADLPSITSSLNADKEKIDLYEEFKNEKTGFNQEGYKQFSSCLNSLYKNRNISNRISFSFLFDALFRWILETYKNNQAKVNFTTYLSDEIMKVSGYFKYSFEVLNLHVEKTFSLGDVQFEFITEEFFANMNSSEQNDLTAFKNKYLGKVYASCSLIGVEKTRGHEVALEKCYKAVNILKLFSQTITHPDRPTNFDIDRRVKVVLKNEYWVRNLKDTKDLSLSLTRNADHHSFSSSQIDSLAEASKEFSTLISQTETNELEKLILNSLNKFSEAISNNNIHKRITELFTIWESLLMRDSNNPIISTVTMNSSKILKRTLEERKEFIKFLKDMYAIRSKVIHHAIEDELNLKDVSTFQIETVHLMQYLLRISKVYTTKDILLDRIENSMISANL